MEWRLVSYDNSFQAHSALRNSKTHRENSIWSLNFKKMSLEKNDFKKKKKQEYESFILQLNDVIPWQ